MTGSFHIRKRKGCLGRYFRMKMHIFSTILVVLLSIVSLVMLIVASAKSKEYRSFGVFAGIALGMMLVGTLGMNIVPKEYVIGCLELSI